MQRTALVTGSAGFIGYFTARALLEAGWRVVGLDALTDYYEVALKERRHTMLNQVPGFSAVADRPASGHARGRGIRRFVDWYRDHYGV